MRNKPNKQHKEFGLRFLGKYLRTHAYDISVWDLFTNHNQETLKRKKSTKKKKKTPNSNNLASSEHNRTIKLT